MFVAPQGRCNAHTYSSGSSRITLSSVSATIVAAIWSVMKDSNRYRIATTDVSCEVQTIPKTDLSQRWNA